MAEISLKTLREERLWSKSELARAAGVSPLTIDRIERGQPCRPDTLRKIILAFGYTPDDKERLFPDIAVFTHKDNSDKT